MDTDGRHETRSFGDHHKASWVVGDGSPFGRWAITGIIERGDMFNLRDVLDMAIQIERNGEAVYRRALARTEDPELIEMLTWMAGEESRHAGHFSDIRQRIDGRGQYPDG